MIRNALDGKVYVGSSIRMRQRWNHHVGLLNTQKHSNRHLQSSWLKSGKDAFEFSVIEECSAETLIVRETAWVAYYDSMNDAKGYNLEYPDRRFHTEETKQRIAEAHRNSPLCRGHKRSEEFKKRISELHRGNQYSKGRVMSDEEKRIRSLAAMGKNKGRKLSPEHRAKLSEAHKGKVISAEHRASLSKAVKASWETRREKGI